MPLWTIPIEVIDTIYYQERYHMGFLRNDVIDVKNIDHYQELTKYIINVDTDNNALDESLTLAIGLAYNSKTLMEIDEDLIKGLFDGLGNYTCCIITNHHSVDVASKLDIVKEAYTIIKEIEKIYNNLDRDEHKLFISITL